jgi:type III secretion protein N (ATPase)
MRAGELRVPLADVAVGEHCHVRRSARDDRVLTHGVVTRVDHGVATLALIGAPVRLAADVVVAATGRPLQVALGTHLLGCVLDGFGEVVERLLGGDAVDDAGVSAPVQAAPLDYRQRRPIQVPFATGIRALDALLTVGEGQRMGIFAAAGCGKTTLVEMLLANADCDVRVVALVGERGREVASFVDAIRKGPAAARTIIVQATSDSSPATRVNAAMVATRIAEYFRDQGSRVLLVMDSANRVPPFSETRRYVEKVTALYQAVH